MDRETKTIKLPICEKEVTIYSFLTGGEKRKINDILLGNLSADIKGNPTGDIPLSTLYKANDKAFELLVVSVGDKKENILNEIENLHTRDYDYLTQEINKITSDSDFLEKGVK